VKVRGEAQRRLEEAGGGRGARAREAAFTLHPRVGERTDGQTFVVCKAVQRAGGQDVYEDVEAKARLNIVYPPQVRVASKGSMRHAGPQPQEEKRVTAELDEPAELIFLVEAFPRPLRQDIRWTGQEASDHYQMAVSFPSASSVRIDLTVLKVEEHDYDIRHSISVRNEHGKQQYHFQVVKPT
jgi:hypothetical protein